MGGGLKIRRKFYNFPDYTIEGGQFDNRHIILCLPRSLTYAHIPSLTLFLSQLVEAGEKEGAALYLTLQFLSHEQSTEEGIPIEVEKVTKDTINTAVSEILNRHLNQTGQFQASPEEQYYTEAERFSWDNLSKVFQKEAKLEIPMSSRSVFLFAPEGAKVNEKGNVNTIENADLVLTAFSTVQAAYPLEFTKIKTSPKTEGVIKHFGVMEPCEMHRRFVNLLGAYQAGGNLAPIKRLFESGSIINSFLYKNALRSIIESYGSIAKAEACDPKFAFETSAMYYMADNNYMAIHSMIWGIGSFINPIIESFLLFKGHKDSLPKPDEIVGESAGYYELLRETKSPSYFIRHILPLIFHTIRIRADYPNRGKLPSPEKTMPSYLEKMSATPLNLFEAVFSFGGLPEDDVESYRFFTYNSGDEYTNLYNKHVKGLFRPLIENFKKLDAGKQEKEIKQILGYINKYIGDTLSSFTVEREGRPMDDQYEILPFLLALDIIYTSLEGNNELTGYLTRGLADALVKVENKRLKLGQGSFLYVLIKFLNGKKVLKAADAKKIIEWTFKFDDLEKDWHIHDLTRDVFLVWRDLWSIMDEVDRQVLQPVLVDKALDIMRKRLKFKEERRAKYESYEIDLEKFIMGYDESRPVDESLPKIAAGILDWNNMAKLAIGLLDEEKFRENIDDYIYPSLRHFYEKGDFPSWKKFVEKFMKDSGYSWQIAPYLLLLSKEHPERFEMLSIVHKELEKFKLLKIFNGNWDYTALLVSAIAENNLKDIYFWHGRTGPFFNPYYINRLLKGHYFTDVLKKETLTFLLQKAADKLEDDDFYDFFQRTLGASESVMAKGYDETLHGRLFEGVFKRLMDMAIKTADEKYSRSRRALYDFLDELFPFFPLERKKSVVKCFLEKLPDYQGKQLDAYLSLFTAVINRIDSAEFLIETKPVFEYLANAIGSGKVTVDNYFVQRFFDQWLRFFKEMPEDVQYEVFTYAAGPLMPALQGNFLETTIRVILRREDGTEDREKARKLGRYIATSPYAVFVAEIFNSELLKKDGTEGIIEGFTDQAYTEGKRFLKKKDVESFLTTGLFSYWHKDKEAYYKFAPLYLRRNFFDEENDVVRLVLNPVRDLYIKIGKFDERFGDLAILLEGLEIGAKLFDKVLFDESIPIARREYARFCFRQVSEEIVRILSNKKFNDPAYVQNLILMIKETRQKADFIELKKISDVSDRRGKE